MIVNEYKINPFPPDFSHRIDELYENKDNQLNKLNKKAKKNGAEHHLILSTRNLLSKIQGKLPMHFQTRCAVTQKGFEQCTSEIIARWKAQNFPAKTLLSLTGGLGVDDWAWSKSGSTVLSLDPDESLNAVVRYNWRRLGIDATRLESTAEMWLEANPDTRFDLVYVDPDRRPQGARKSFQAEDYLPNVFDLIQVHGAVGKLWLIKLSPMTDPHWIFNHFEFHTEIMSIGYKNEAKEILVLVDPSKDKSSVPMIDCIEIITKDVAEISSVRVTESKDTSAKEIPDKSESDKNILGQRFSELRMDALSINAGPLLWEPSPAIFASSLHTSISQRFHLLAATPNPGFFHTQREIPAAFGRCLLVQNEFQGSLRKIAQNIKDLKITQLNITPRSCGIPTSEITKTLKTKEGGPLTLFITKKQNEFHAWLGEIQKF
ncbi:MAG: hypothetical protein O2814_05325 [Bacteroidetes bacterium]|nr:hypothetical protein [Bacteroidota bacterium]MDA1223775.1 hypothetical protein [Bacteroidota bacterium]